MVTVRGAERHLDAVDGREPAGLVPLVGEAHVVIEIGDRVAGLEERVVIGASVEVEPGDVARVPVGLGARATPSLLTSVWECMSPQ